MEGLVHPQAEEMALSSGLQLWVLGECPHAGIAGVQLKAALGPTCRCSESPTGNGRGCS